MFHHQRTRTRSPCNRRPRGGPRTPRPPPFVVPTNTFTRPSARGTLWVPTRGRRPDQHPQSPRLNEGPQPPQPAAPEDDGRLSRSSSDIRLPSICSLSSSGLSSTTTRPPPRIEIQLPVAQVQTQVRPRPRSLGQSVIVGIRVERMNSVLAAWDKRWDAAYELPTYPEKEESEEDESKEEESKEDENKEEESKEESKEESEGEDEENEEKIAPALPTSITITIATLAKDETQALDENTKEEGDGEDEEEDKEGGEEGAPALPTAITIAITTPAKDEAQALDENKKEDDKAEALPSSEAGGVALPRSVVEDLYRPKTTREMQLEQLKAKIPWLVGQGTLGGAGWRPLEEYYWDEGGSGET